MITTHNSNQPPRRSPALLAITRGMLAALTTAVVIAFRMADWVRNQLFDARTRLRHIRAPRSNRAPEQSGRDRSDLEEKATHPSENLGDRSVLETLETERHATK
jgi:hypothetical protein